MITSCSAPGSSGFVSQVALEEANAYHALTDRARRMPAQPATQRALRIEQQTIAAAT